MKISSLKKLILSSFIALSFSISAFAQNQIVGNWYTEEKDAIIQIYEQQGLFYGKIAWLKNPNDSKGKPELDDKNPDKFKRNQPILGLQLLKDFSYIDGEWKNGKVYDPQSGKLYTCTLWMLDNNRLKVRGYWGLFYATQVWTRVK